MRPSDGRQHQVGRDAGESASVDHPTTSGSSRNTPLRRRTPLDTGWRLRLATAHADAPAALLEASIPASVPGNVFLDLLAARLIPDPYLGTNELATPLDRPLRLDLRADLRLGARPRRAAGPRVRGARHARLGLARWPAPGRRGEHAPHLALGRSRSCSRRARHTLEVRFAAPVTAAERLSAELGTYPHSNAYPRAIQHAAHHGLHLRLGLGSAAAGRGYLAAGLDRVQLGRTAWRGPATGRHRRHDRAGQRRRSTWSASVIRAVTLRVVRTCRATSVAEMPDAAGRSAVTADAGRARRRTMVAALPWAHQPRTPLRVELWDQDTLLDAWERPIGFRTIELDTRADDIGSRVPAGHQRRADLGPGRQLDPRRLLPGARDPRAIPGPGSCRRRRPTSTCSGCGAAACSSRTTSTTCATSWACWSGRTSRSRARPTPRRPRCTRTSMAEARDNVTRLMAHPSLVLWNGNNECVWLAEDRRLGARSWAVAPWGRTWWDERLPATVGLTDPERPYWPGSPTSPTWTRRAGQRSRTTARCTSGTSGTSWTTRRTASIDRGSPRSSATRDRRRGRRSTRAIGAHELTAESAVAGAPPEGHRWHGQAGTGPRPPIFAVPVDFDDWLYLAQLNQARAIALGVEHLRSIRDVCSGHHRVAAQRLLAGHLVGRRRR